MCLTEYDEELHMETVRREGWEEGHQAGEKRGHMEAVVGNLRKLTTNLELTEEEAMDALEIPEKERDEIKRKLKE